MRLFLLPLLLILLGAYPVHAFAVETVCENDIMHCSCTDDDGDTVSMRSSSVNTATACHNYCYDRNAVSYAFFCGHPSTPDNAGDITGSFNEFIDATTITDEDPAIPSLNVPIPGLDLENSVYTDGEGYVVSNMIGLYVDAVFRYAIVIGALIGVLILTLSGFQYMTAGGDKGRVAKAKDRIRNTIFGLILLMATYSIAYLIDPRTTRFAPFRLQNIAAVEYFPPDGEDTDIIPNDSLTGSGEVVTGEHIIVPTRLYLDADALDTLQEAANDFYELTGKNIYIAAAKRDLHEQATLFYNNCLRNGGVCSPATCSPANNDVVTRSGSRYSLVGELAAVRSPVAVISGMVNHASYGNCPHTSAVAVDAWCSDGGSNYQHDPACQERLIETMTEHGFCRLTAEPWHFELNSKKVSRGCLTTNNRITYTTASDATYTPNTTTCTRWDFKKHLCILQ